MSRLLCVEFRREVRKDGYGQVTVDGKKVLAHRFAWVSVFGPIPSGLCVCHRCDNRLCVRPDHLFLGTHQENMRDMLRKGRHARHGGRYLQGRPGHRKAGQFRGVDVAGIVLHLALGGKTGEVAARCGVSPGYVSVLRRRFLPSTVR